MEQWSGFAVDQRKQLKTGRAWRAEELRLKNHDDLHKLWYVMLKEKNKLKSDFLMSKQLQQAFYGYSDIVKVRLSMSRLLTVVNERKRLRSLYRQRLEDEYIAEKKQEEEKRFLEVRKKLIEEGKSYPLLPKERTEKLKQRQARNVEQLAKAKAAIKEQLENGETSAAPLMNEADVDFLATTKVKLTQREIVQMYVGNWMKLDLKQRRKVMSYVQAQRSKHAKEVFLKELGALGRKLE